MRANADQQHKHRQTASSRNTRLLFILQAHSQIVLWRLLANRRPEHDADVEGRRAACKEELDA